MCFQDSPQIQPKLPGYTQGILNKCDRLQQKNHLCLSLFNLINEQQAEFCVCSWMKSLPQACLILLWILEVLSGTLGEEFRGNETVCCALVLPLGK